MYVEEVNAELKKKIAYYYGYAIGGALVTFISSLLLYIIVATPRQVSVGDTVFLSLMFFFLYTIGFVMIYVFFKRGYPTSYIITNDGVEVLFRDRQLAFIPFAVIEKVTLDREGPSFHRFIVGRIYDVTARKSEQYVAIHTPFFTYYLSPSNPRRFMTKLKYSMNRVAAPIKSDTFRRSLKEDRSSKIAFVRKLLVLLFVKIPIGQIYISTLLFWGLIFVGYPQLVSLFLTLFLLAIHLVIYLFSSSIASELLRSRPCTINEVNRIVTSLTNKVNCAPSKIEICDPMIKGLNAFATGSPLTSKIILTEDIVKLPTHELNAIIAHEIGHIKYGHALKLNIISFSFLVLLLLAPIHLFLVIFTIAFFVMSFMSKFLENAADIFAAEMTNPKTLVSALSKAAEDAVYRLYVLNLTLTGKPKSQEEIKESMGLKPPNSILRKLFLWIFSTHPPLYYRINMLNKLATQHERTS